MRNLTISTLRNLMHIFPKQNYCIYRCMQIKFRPYSVVTYFLTHQNCYSVLSSPQHDANIGIKLLYKEFPEPKKIFSDVLNEAFVKNENLDLKPTVSSEQIAFGQKDGFLWRVAVSMKWPEEFIVEGIANKKAEAENIAFLYACQKLKSLGLLDHTNKPLLLNNKFNINENRTKNAKTDLLNIYQKIWARHGKREYMPIFTASSVTGITSGSKFWKSQLELIYPENKVFEAIALRIRDADDIAASKALVWLYSQGVINKNRQLIQYSKEDEKKLRQSHNAPYSICIPQKIQDKVETVLSDLKDMMPQLSDIRESISNDSSGTLSSAVHNIFTEEIYSELSEDELYQRNWQLFEKRRLFENKVDPTIADIKKVRSSLPVFENRENILKLIDENQVVVLSGETGCGKSTQISQFMLDHFIDQKKGSKCNIVVTQPRRISAVSLADRVAQERGETVGDTVGYQIRFSRCLPSGNGAILYCTTGLLLRKIHANPNLEGVSHIIVDEVHERNIHIDILLIILQRLLQSNKKIKLILMSASFNTYLFSQYFNSCPVIHIPGKTYPVKEYFLEDLAEYIPFKTINQNMPVLDVGLLVDVIKYIDENKPSGAILCFLPGWHDIRSVHSRLTENSETAADFHICSIHSRLPKEEQMNIFSKPDSGKRKVILATNIAETSITVNDVVYVVNSGLHKGTVFDTDAGIASLTVQWITKANVRQRRGRAGRVQPGICYHLFSRKVFMEMDEYPVAEILRQPLESVILQCKSYSPDSKAEEFLSQAIQPPSFSSIQNGLQDLESLGVLDNNENLTNLGKVAVHFGLHPRLSVALIYGAFLRCLDPILTICSILSLEKEPFINTLDDKFQIKKIKEMHDNDMCSDHLALNKIFNTWKSLTEKTEVSDYVQKHQLDQETLTRIDQLKELFAEELYVAKFITKASAYSDSSSKCNENSQHIPSILTVLTRAFYPNLVKIIQGEITHGKLHKESIIYSLIKGQKAYIQKESVVSEKEELPSPWLVYFSAMKSEARRLAMMSSLSSVPGISLLLMAGKDVYVQNVEEAYDPSRSSTVLLVDGNKKLNFSCSPKEAHLLLDTREYLNQIFQLYILTLRSKNIENSEYAVVCQNKLFPVIKEILDSPNIPFTKGQMYEFVDNELVVKEL